MKFTLPPQVLDCDLVLQFFWRFSVFECALKREGFLKSRPYTEAAEADWDRFSSKIQGKFDGIMVPGFQKAVDQLWRLSPQRQVVRNGKLSWEPVLRTPTDSIESYTIKLLKTARNNLFHGGKYPDGTIHEIARDRVILRAGLTILDGCYRIHDGLKRRIDAVA